MLKLNIKDSLTKYIYQKETFPLQQNLCIRIIYEKHTLGEMLVVQNTK